LSNFDSLQDKFHSLWSDGLMMRLHMLLVVFASREISVAARNFTEESQLLVDGEYVAIQVVCREIRTITMRALDVFFILVNFLMQFEPFPHIKLLSAVFNVADESWLGMIIQVSP